MKLKRPSAYWAELDEKKRSSYRIVAAVLLVMIVGAQSAKAADYVLTYTTGVDKDTNTITIEVVKPEDVRRKNK